MIATSTLVSNIHERAAFIPNCVVVAVTFATGMAKVRMATALTKPATVASNDP
jgi:hypothetical protein